VKSIALIAAIQLLCPSMTLGTREVYANLIDEQVAKTNVDPLLVVAIIDHESKWHTDADNGRCVGLGQVCLSTQSACKGKDGLEAPACQARRAELMDGPTNIRVIVSMLEQWKQHCKTLTGHAQTHHILSGYAGTDREGIQCGQRQRFTGNEHERVWRDAPKHKVVREILAIYQHLKNTKGTKSPKHPTRKTKNGAR